MPKLAIILTHPIQYYSPLFVQMAQEKSFVVKVFYTFSQSQEKLYDKDFGREIKWDIPLLEGYEYKFVANEAKHPSLSSFRGIQNPTLIKSIENWGATHVLVFGWNYQSHLRAMVHFKGRIPVLFRGDSTLLGERPGIKKVLRRAFLSLVYHFVDRALYVGTNNKNYFLKHGVKEKQLTFTPHAIDNGRFLKRDESEIIAWRTKNNIPLENIIVSYAGKLDENKNVQLIVDTAKELARNDITFVIIGNGVKETELKEQCLFLQNIQFHPFANQSEMPLLYSVCDIFCLPSHLETWGLAINEAMASGKCVITTPNVGCAVDLVKEANGYIIRSAVELTMLLSHIDIKTIRIKGENSRRVIVDWSFEKISNNIAKAL